jgi:hypothetical protein
MRNNQLTLPDAGLFALLRSSFPRIVLLFSLTGSVATWAENPQYVVNPSSFALGKSYVIIIQNTKCDATSTDTLKSANPVVSGSSIKISAGDPAATQCVWTGNLTVGQDAETGDFNLEVPIPNKDSVLIPIKVISKAAGPIPPGLEPTVDVAWGVLPKRISSDTFGSRVTKLYYPIEVVIGNNSGYDLQLASVQFKLPEGSMLDTNIPTNSYYVVRASLQREQLIGARNTTINIIKAIGPILTGSAVFFNGSSIAALHHKNVFLGLTDVFSNPFEKGLELIFPDQTVQQLINLDNHTLRDGAVIANNTQVRTIVFVNRDLLVRSALNNGAQRLHAQEYRAIDQKLATEIAAADALQTTHMSGLASSTDPGHVASEKVLAAATAETAKAAAVQAAAKAKEEADKRAVAASTAEYRSSAMMQARMLGGDGGKFGKHEYDEQEVMRQLGSLQLIGRSIAYLNRVSVISNPPGAGPQFTLSPATITQDSSNKSVALTLTGDGLSGGTLTSSDKSLVISNPKVGDGGKSFTATLDPSAAEPGTYTLTLTTATASQSAQLTIKPADIVITSGQSVSLTKGDKDVAASLSGKYLKNVTGINVDKTNCPDATITLLDKDSLYTDETLRISLSAPTAAKAPTCTATASGKSGNTQTFQYVIK